MNIMGLFCKASVDVEELGMPAYSFNCVGFSPSLHALGVAILGHQVQ